MRTAVRGRQLVYMRELWRYEMRMGPENRALPLHINRIPIAQRAQSHFSIITFDVYEFYTESLYSLSLLNS